MFIYVSFLNILSKAEKQFFLFLCLNFLLISLNDPITTMDRIEEQQLQAKIRQMKLMSLFLLCLAMVMFAGFLWLTF